MRGAERPQLSFEFKGRSARSRDAGSHAGEACKNLIIGLPPLCLMCEILPLAGKLSSTELSGVNCLVSEKLLSLACLRGLGKWMT